ncbi:MAG: spore maturation protein [Clostridia bacterium]|nr:spore maturation protein [Clostridia bacterium]
MNAFFSLIIPIIFILSFVYAKCKKVKIYDSFTDGVKGAIPLIVSIFPYLAAVTMLSTLLTESGLEKILFDILSPLLKTLGVPTEIAPLLIVKPLSGSGSIAVISDILEKHGADSYISRCACVAYGSSETIFYIGAIYFSSVKRKKLSLAVLLALLTFLLSAVFSCFLCKIM